MQQHQPESDILWRHGYVIAVVGPKGGVGKTFVAVNLAVGLAKMNPGSKVVLVDCHPRMGDVGIFFDVRGEYSITEFAGLVDDAPDTEHQIIDSALVHHQSGVSLLSGPPDLFRDDVNFLNTVELLKKYYDYIILDTVADMDGWDFEAISSAAHRTVVVTEPGMPSLKNTLVLLRSVNEHQLTKILLVLNQVSKDGAIPVEQVSAYLQKKCPIAVQIPHDAEVVHSINTGTPLLDGLPKKQVSEELSLAGAAMLDLTQLVMTHLPPDKIQQLRAKHQPPQLSKPDDIGERTPEEAVYAALIEQMLPLMEGLAGRVKTDYVVIRDHTTTRGSIDDRTFDYLITKLQELHESNREVVQKALAKRQDDSLDEEALLDDMLPQLQRETFDSFVKANLDEQPLSATLDLGRPYVLMSDEDWREIMRLGGWQAFYNLYPDTAGTIELSGIGLNSQQDQALVLFGKQMGRLFGRGNYVILEKQPDGWRVKTMIEAWVS